MKVFHVAAILLAGAPAALPASIGVIGGVPLTDAFDSIRGESASYVTNTKRYLVGPSVEFDLPAGLSIEVDALYKRLGYQYTQVADSVVANTVANSWEFPGTLKWRFVPGPIQPFIQGGVSVRHISGVKQIRTAIDAVGSAVRTEFNTAPEFNKRNDIGFVFGAGIRFDLGAVNISPSARYTRWGSETFRDPVNALLRTNRNQGDFLLSITF